MHHWAGAKGSHGTPVSSLRRTALQLSQAANSPVPRHAMRPASAPPVRPGGVGGGSDVTESNIKVYIRTRPAATINGAVCVTPDPGASSIMVQAQVTDVKGTPRKGRGAEVTDAVDAFVFEDGVLEPEVSQQDVFDTIGRPAAEAVLDGYNVTIFAYGQTGAGKTHTIYGSGTQSDQDEHAAGMAPHTGLTDRVMNFLIASANTETRTHASVSYRYAVSMLDIYDEKVTDLFEPGHEKKVREGPKGGVYVEGQRWQAVTSGVEASRQVNQGIQGRRVCHTSMNSASSRSHTICMFRVSRDEEQEGGQVMNRQGIITIVDLCGSERVKKSEVQGSRLKEAININSSLSALKTVITAIGDGASHVPFRSSKLTWVLKDCIGGNSKVAIIAHINPCSAHAYESVSTLRFVSVVKSVKTRVTKNERLKTEEEIAQEEAEKAAAQALNQELLIQEARKRWELELPPPPPPYLAPETADASTQVSPDKARRSSGQASDGHDKRASGVGSARCSDLINLKQELLQLQALLQEGILDEHEFHATKKRLLGAWQPPMPSGGSWSPEEVQQAVCDALGRRHLEPDHDTLLNAQAKPDAICLTIKGPDMDAESDIMVRLSAQVSTVADAVQAALSGRHGGSRGVSLFYQGVELSRQAIFADLNLVHACLLQAQWTAEADAQGANPV